MPSSALVTGGAGFIGSHLVDRLLADGWQVTVLDNFDPFYDPAHKRRNILPHLDHRACTFIEGDLRDVEIVREGLTGEYDVIVHLAAKAGVRPSIADPLAYQQVNVGGTQLLLECARRWGTRQFVFASSSSVYGVSPNVPWREDDSVLLPISPYASTKVSGELLGHVYSHLFGMRFVALRFFTVYGPRQRPDLAIRRFAESILRGEPVALFGDGSSRRDYTYVEDIVDGIVAAMRYEGSPFEVFNLGNNRPVRLLDLLEALARTLGVPARVERLPEQPGDVPQTWAAIDKGWRLLGYRPRTPLMEGLERFAGWLAEGREVRPGSTPALPSPLERRSPAPISWGETTLPRTAH